MHQNIQKPNDSSFAFINDKEKQKSRKSSNFGSWNQQVFDLFCFFFVFKSTMAPILQWKLHPLGCLLQELPSWFIKCLVYKVIKNSWKWRVPFDASPTLTSRSKMASLWINSCTEVNEASICTCVGPSSLKTSSISCSRGMTWLNSAADLPPCSNSSHLRAWISLVDVVSLRSFRWIEASGGFVGASFYQRGKNESLRVALGVTASTVTLTPYKRVLYDGCR